VHGGRPRPHRSQQPITAAHDPAGHPPAWKRHRRAYPAVTMRGSATVVTADDAATDKEIRAITRRYIVPEDVAGYIARWPDLRTIVTIIPALIVSWPGEAEI
jgi:hypothetical protein